MDKIPVLLLISSNIDVEILNSSPRFFPYVFFTLPALHYLERTSSEILDHGLPYYLNKKIRRIKPIYLIVHLGMAFERYPIEYLNAILDAKLLYPEMRIGFDKGIQYILQQLQTSEINSEKNNLIGRLAQNRSIFEVDKDIIHLLGVLY